MHSPARSVRCQLSFNDDSIDTTTSSNNSSPQYSDLESEEEEEEDFQTVPLDDEFWSTEMVPEQTLCIHENMDSQTVHALTHALTDIRVPPHI